MPPEDQATRTASRCATHPSSPSVAMCHSCARPLCLRCAIPVRGEVFGPECLPGVLGPDAAPPKPVPSRPRHASVLATGLAFAGAVAGSILPWTPFGDPSGMFGGWAIDPQRWSSLATYPAVVGLGIWIAVALRRRSPSVRWSAALVALSAAVVAGSVLHILDPPPFTHAWLGPWVTLGFGVLAVPASAAALWRAIAAKSPKGAAP